VLPVRGHLRRRCYRAALPVAVRGAPVSPRSRAQNRDARARTRARQRWVIAASWVGVALAAGCSPQAGPSAFSDAAADGAADATAGSQCPGEVGTPCSPDGLSCSDGCNYYGCSGGVWTGTTLGCYESGSPPICTGSCPSGSSPIGSSCQFACPGDAGYYVIATCEPSGWNPHGCPDAGPPAGAVDAGDGDAPVDGDASDAEGQ
jgi:hypothetical protein